MGKRHNIIRSNSAWIEFAGNLYGLFCYKVQAGSNLDDARRMNYGLEMNLGSVGSNIEIGRRTNYGLEVNLSSVGSKYRYYNKKIIRLWDEIW